MSRIPKRKLFSQPASRRSRAALQNAAHVLTRMREGYSLTSASAEHGIDPRTVERVAGAALRKTKSGRYAARVSDNLVRELIVAVPGGSKVYTVRGSRAASEIAARSSAQQYYLATGDSSRLRKLRGTVVRDIYGNEVPYLDDLDELERLGDAGVLQFESIYARRV